MFQKINAAFEWRYRVFKHKFNKKRWLLKKNLDFSPKEKAKSISIVVVGRNDNYGGDFSLRLKTTIDWNLSRFPGAELIYIEWNPLSDKPSDTIWMSERYPNAKLYIIPNEIHQKFAGAVKFPILEYFAKNIGIRKASGDYIALINADILMGTDIQFDQLSKSNVYGSHFTNIKWKGENITEDFLNNKNIVLASAAAPFNLESVVGNFILTHRDNWMKMTGYDERLVDVRNGVDSNGLKMLLHLGLKPIALGHHYHLDHPESLINGANPTHGSNERIKQLHDGINIPYSNSNSWGMNDFIFEQINTNVWKAKAKQ
jgi:hypothetical protein